MLLKRHFKYKWYNYHIKSFSESLSTELKTPYQLNNLPWGNTTGNGITELPPYSISIVSLPKNVVTSTSNEFHNEPILISPNPTKDKITFSKSTQWSLFTITGQLIEEGNGDILDLSVYTNGMYIIKSGTQSFKVIKE